MQVVAFAKWLQSSYCMFSGFYVSCQTIPGDLNVFVHADYLTIFKMKEKLQLGLQSCCFELEKSNQQACLLWRKIFDDDAVLWMLNPGTTLVCQHSVLPYLFSHKQYSMCILMTRRCAYPIVQVFCAYLCRLPCLLSFPCLNSLLCLVSYSLLCL